MMKLFLEARNCLLGAQFCLLAALWILRITGKILFHIFSHLITINQCNDNKLHAYFSQQLYEIDAIIVPCFIG